jgi:hypothetical protein
MAINSGMPLVTILFRILDQNQLEMDAIINSIANQTYKNLEINFFCETVHLSYLKDKCEVLTCPYSINLIDVSHEKQRINRKGKFLSQAINMMRGEYLAVIEPGWRWNCDHIASLVKIAVKETDCGLVFAGTYQNVFERAPFDSTQVQRFFSELTVEDFKKHKALIDMPSFLVARHLLEPIKTLLVLFEYHEALMLFVKAKVLKMSVLFSKKITVSRVHSLELNPLNHSLEKDSVWARVARKLGNEDYEFKLVFDQVRFFQKLDNQMWIWLAVQASHIKDTPGITDTTNITETIKVGNNYFTHFVEICRKIPFLYYILRFSYRSCRSLNEMLPSYFRLARR